MKISYKWLSEMVDLSGVGGPEALAELLTRRGVEVEEVSPLAKGFEKVVTAKILERAKHPEADRLSLCKVSTGAGEPIEIVCGAQNMKAGDIVAMAQVGAHLPNDMKIAQGKIRGVVSNGMLCSEEELRLKDKSEGILILPPSTPLGRPLAEILGRDDVILTFKATPNRGDLLSHYGLAREVASAIGKTAKRPEAEKVAFAQGGGNSPVSVALEAGESAPQFFGVSIDGVKVGPSPAWLVARLEAVGQRSINNVVDATNLVLMELGHPMHAYDADRIEGNKIQVRVAQAGEELPLLDGQTVKLAGTELVIADGKRAVGLAGVMGGGNSEVQDGTTRLFLECAEFAPAMVRRAATRHVRRTEAAQRFEKGVDPQGLEHAIGRLTKVILELAGGKVVGGVKAQLPSRASYKARVIELDAGFIPAFLGMELSAKELAQPLESQGCAIAQAGAKLTVTIPSHRLDLAIPEDLAEEVARTVGYDQIPSTLPALSNAPLSRTASPAGGRATLLDRAKQALAQAGLLEAVNLGFAAAKELELLHAQPTVRVLNPLSEEHEFMVPSLLPGLIRNVRENWRRHFGSEEIAVRLFELRPTFHAREGAEIRSSDPMTINVEERWKLAIAISGPRMASGLRNDLGEVDFYDLRAVLDALFDALGVRGVRVMPLSASRTAASQPLSKSFHPGQSVEILAGPGVAGYAGLAHPRLAQAISQTSRTRSPLWIAELDWEALSKLARPADGSRQFKPWSEFPPMERDFALLVKKDVSADKIVQLAIKAGKPLAKVVKVFDIYRGSQVAEGMTSVAVRVIFSEEGRSLQEPETEAASGRILDAWKKELGAELRS